MFGRGIAQSRHEHAYSKAYSAKHTDARKRFPVGVLGHLHEAQLDAKPRETQHTTEFAD